MNFKDLAEKFIEDAGVERFDRLQVRRFAEWLDAKEFEIVLCPLCGNGPKGIYGLPLLKKDNRCHRCGGHLDGATCWECVGDGGSRHP